MDRRREISGFLFMKKGKFISLRKLESINKFDGALIDGYTIKGYLIDDISVGNKINVIRTERNGIEVPGWFESSVIENIEGNNIKTNNSQWEIKVINENE
jgi:hypothetical protein